MLRSAAILFVLLLTPLLFAQSADLEVTLTGPEAVPLDQTFTVNGTVTNKGPNAAENVVVYLTVNFENVCVNSVNVGTLAAGETRRYECSGSIPKGNRFYRAIAALEARTSTQDPFDQNNVASHSVGAISPPDLFIFDNGVMTGTPGLPIPVSMYYGNRAEFPATNVTITITSPAGFGTVPEHCTVDGQRAVCTIGTVESSLHSLSFEVIAPDVSAAAFDLRTEIDGSEEDTVPEDDVWIRHAQNYRTFFVTNTADAGSGSLRSAIEGANADCADDVPCLIAFRIPAAAQAWHTIAPLSPLPHIHPRRGLTIDGGTQSRYFSDTNAHGPEIELTGAALGETNGLEIAVGCTARVSGLTLNGFSGSAIVLTPGETCQQGGAERLIESNYIGTDPTGTIAVPNHRGIWVATPSFRILDNIISGNLRAGVFVASGAAFLYGNRIGLGRELQALGNGASGVFISDQAGNSDLRDNYIGFNAHFGIAIAHGTPNVSATMNSIQANAQHGIDWGLDGTVTRTPIPLPEIASAHFENGHTIIEGTISAMGTSFPLVALYANDAPDPSGYGEGQYVLGEISGRYDEQARTFRFTFVWPGDLRGKWVTATVTRTIYNGFLRAAGPGSDADRGGVLTTSSEFSRAVAVR